jgi:hypothetical protein
MNIQRHKKAITHTIQLQKARKQGIFHEFLRPVEHQISEKAIYMVAAIYNRFLPDTDFNKPRLRENVAGWLFKQRVFHVSIPY